MRVLETLFSTLYGETMAFNDEDRETGVRNSIRLTVALEWNALNKEESRVTHSGLSND